MISILDMAQGRLAPTATYHVREWRWLPHEVAHDGRIGTLVIILAHRARRELARGRYSKATELEIDTYGVREETHLGATGRVFLLRKDKPPEEEERERQEAYRCVVGGMVETCGCQAGGFDRVRTLANIVGCKHRDALRAMIADGVI